MTTTEPSDKAKYVRRVQALLDRAAHPDTPEAERRSSLEKANAMMFTHRVDEAMLNAQKSKAERKRDIVTREYSLQDHFEFMGDQVRMMFSVYKFSGAQVIRRWGGIECVGFEDDMENADMLWFTISMDFITKLFPEWNSLSTVQANVFNLKSSGKSWMDIVKLAPPEAQLNANSGSTLRAMYKREAEKRGIDPNTVQHSRTPKKYRVNFSEAFASRICQRLAELSKEYHEENDRDESKSLALRSDSELVDEAFYAKYPHLHPQVLEDRLAKEREERAKLRDEAAQAETLRWNSLTTRQQQKEIDQQIRRQQRQARQWARMPSSHDPLGWANGAQAADSVNLQPSKEFGSAKGELNG